MEYHKWEWLMPSNSSREKSTECLFKEKKERRHYYLS